MKMLLVYAHLMLLFYIYIYDEYSSMLLIKATANGLTTRDVFDNVKSFQLVVEVLPCFIVMNRVIGKGE